MRNSKFIIAGLFSLLLFSFVACEPIDSDPEDDGTTADNNAISQEELELRESMNRLWTDHVTWTRAYIVAAVAETPDAEAAANRLLKNQEDIGSAVGNYYGSEAGNQLTDLLKEHITIAVDLIEAAKNEDTSAFDESNAAWVANGQEIADFLAAANPHWPQAGLRDMMQSHLRTTTDEVTARINEDHEADVRAYDAVYDHILMMSDALSDGIVKQFPERF